VTSATVTTNPPDRQSDTRLELDVLVTIVTGLARAEPLWRPHVAHDPFDRVRQRLLATPAYEVWLLGWTPGQSVGLHDHGDANGAFVVVDGTLVETAVVAGALDDEAVPAGGVGRVPVGSIHDVANRSRRNATSIHVYSRPLSAMGFYGPDGVVVRVEAVHEQSTLVAADELTRVLHPARASIAG
jgi:predicted metal-dependent enzyme (double-stranded beta helix superfamily)